jgi:UDP-N-acetylglucosamine--N-acetylmuramyl-(pentapeptide) pyrophosphoryl-undecaprenol N-acetylglucosamine transferase
VESKKIIISGGGTGGHIFPAIAIANALKKIDPATEILFVGATGRMEMEKVPAAGYEIIGLDIQGIQRGSIVKNLAFPFKLISSVRKAIKIIKDFKPDAVVGVGGYASGPILYAASLKNIPYLIHMQALELYKLSAFKKTILVIGGSLGARTLNNSIKAGLDKIIAADVQLIWQTGKFYYKDIIEKLGENYHEDIRIVEFLNRMDLAYAAADIIISRAGAGSIAELCAVKKPVILVPSPNVAEDHQTKNALALVQEHAAAFVADRDAGTKLVDKALGLLNDNAEKKMLADNIAKLALPDADEVIAKEVMRIANGS